jgi:hypothetical protein
VKINSLLRFFINIIGQRTIFWAMAFLKFCHILSGFQFSGFRKKYFFYRTRSSALRPTSNLEGQIPIFMFPRDRVSQLHPQPPDTLFFFFYDSQGCGSGEFNEITYYALIMRLVISAQTHYSLLMQDFRWISRSPSLLDLLQISPKLLVNSQWMLLWISFPGMKSFWPHIALCCPETLCLVSRLPLG